MDLIVFEENRPYILECFCEGDFDYIEAASEVVETDFFRFIKAKSILQDLAATYPSPREKHDVPLWLYVAANLSMRLHGVHAFHAFPTIVRTGGMLNAFGAKAGRKVVHPDTGETTVLCEGTNKKNHYQRQTPCDHDYVRKLARDTEPGRLMQWFNTDVAQMLRTKRAFEKEGLCIGDASYLFVPDNPHYEGSVRLRFDEHNHPLSQKQYEEMTEAQKEHCQWRRCYKMVSLLHLSRNLDYFVVIAVAMISGKDHECPVLYELVDQAVETLGKGVIKRLILDRGFLDGERISRCKQQLGIDVLIPVRRRMDIYDDAMALFKQKEVQWMEYAPPVPPPSKPIRPRPKPVRNRERTRQATLRQQKEKAPPPPPHKTVLKSEVAAIGQFDSWSSCSVALTAVACRETFADGHQDAFLLLDTAEGTDPTACCNDYRLRTSIEERHRQWKCFCDLTYFTSRAFSLVVNQVVFILLAFNLLQLFLRRQKRKDLANKPPPAIRQQLLPTANHAIVYYQNYYGLFTPLELVGLTARLPEDPRAKIARRCERLHRQFNGLLQYPRPP
jgi:hypothetical protein